MSTQWISDEDAARTKRGNDKYLSKKNKESRERFVRTFVTPTSADAAERRAGSTRQRSGQLERSADNEPKRGEGRGLWGAISDAIGKTSEGLFSGLNDAVTRQTAQREAMLQQMMQQQMQSQISPIEAAMLALPNQADYLSPYDDAEKAARTAYDAGKAVIGSSTEELKGDLSRNQQDYLAMQQQYRQEMERDQGAMQDRMAQDLAPSGLAQALGVDDAIAAEAGLLQAQANQQASAQRNLFNRMGEVQGQDYDARVKGADGAEAAAQMAASQNLSTILQQIGMGRADATRQFNEDTAQVKAANAESERRARDEMLKLQEQEQKELEKWEQSQAKAVKGAQTTTWRQKEDQYLSRWPVAAGAFSGLLQAAGEEPTRANRQRALNLLDTVIADVKEASGKTLNRDVLRSWIKEHYDSPTINESLFYELGGEAAYLQGLR